MGGHNYDGHTEIFATLTHTKDYAMMFYGPLKIMHVSTHCSLREACDRATKERVLTCIRLICGGWAESPRRRARIIWNRRN